MVELASYLSTGRAYDIWEGICKVFKELGVAFGILWGEARIIKYDSGLFGFTFLGSLKLIISDNCLLENKF